MPRSTVTYKLHEIEALILRDIEARGLRAISPVRFYATWAHTIRAEVDCEPPPPEEPEAEVRATQGPGHGATAQRGV